MNLQKQQQHPSVPSMTPPLSLAAILRAVPLARQSPEYYATVFVDGEATFAAPDPQLWAKAALPTGNVLELGAGRFARWSTAVGKAPLTRSQVAADLTPPACGCAECIAADNTRLEELAAARPQSFDLIYGSHVLCTCRWVASPLRFARGADSGTTAVTCGGLPIDKSAVDNFVASLGQLLEPSNGVAVFDQEGGWAFGLESELRRAATANGLHFYVRRGPLWTNFDYVFSTTPLIDDVSSDSWQRDARLVDLALVGFAPAVLALIAAVRHGDVPREYVPLLTQAKGALALYIGLRLVLPFADVLTTSDVGFALQSLVARVRGPSK